jgi:hypothetical protein
MAKLALKKSTVRFVTIFVAVAAVSGFLFYFFSPEIFKYRPQPNEWVHDSGLVFAFRQNLADARAVQVDSTQCNNMFGAFNNAYTTNVTIYAKNDPSDFSLHNLEITEITTKMVAYYAAEDKRLGFKSDIWNLEDSPLGSPVHPRIYLIGPTSAQNTSVSFQDSVVFVSGTSVANMDLAAMRAMMCMFGAQ